MYDENLNKGHKQFDKAQHDNKQHMTKVLHLYHVIWHFENKTPDVKSFIVQSHSKIPLHHIIPRNNLDKIKHL